MFYECLQGDSREAWGLSVRRPLHCSGDQGPVHEGDSKLGAEGVLEARENDK